jgi:hypothetical protein
MAEIYSGEIRNGVVVFEGTSPPLPEGTKVRVEPVDRDAALTSLSRLLLSVAGTAVGLPSDMAENHDHYLHGVAKRTDPTE